MAIQHFDEGAPRLEKHGFQVASIGDHALIRFGIEAFQQIEIGFGVSNHVPNRDCMGRARQPDSAMFPSRCGNESVDPEVVHYLYQMIPGYLVEVGQLGDRHGFSFLVAEIEQNTQGVVRVEGQAHDFFFQWFKFMLTNGSAKNNMYSE